MTRRSTGPAAAGLFALLAATACGAGGAEPVPAPAPAAAAPAAAAATGRAYTEADVRFMQHMIAHHAQALAMTALVPGRAAGAGMPLLAERIEVSQRDEIAQMQAWLRSRGREVPSADPQHAHHAGGGEHASMPGMLTPEQLARLEAARGAEFDRLFLELMIRHHEGALVMVAQLFASPGAGQEPDVFRFASDVEADQRAEIARMRRLLDAAPAATPRR